MAFETSPGAVTSSKPPILWLGVGGLALVSLAAAAAIALRPSAPEPQMVPLNSAKPAAAMTSEKGAPSAATAPALATPGAAAARPVKATTKPAKSATEPVHVAAVCSYCGVVESVRAVQKHGEATGVGAVAGGVLGAAVGNQMGHGNGRAAMTVLGAVGGGLAGNEVEKRARAETVFQVRVRLDDGTIRTFEQTAAPKVGERVEVQGNKLKTAA